jgi:predicted DNA-binding transcriptional regulator YafY
MRALRPVTSRTLTGGAGSASPGRTLSDTSRRTAPSRELVAPRLLAKENAGVGRQGAFKDRPLWRRLQTIHHEIKEGRHPNTSTLAAALGVSTKTVQRDLDYLRDELDAPIEFRREENGYAYARGDYVLPFLPVDGQDLFSIGVAAQVLALLGGTPLARSLRSCYERLARLMPPAVRVRPEVVREKLTLRAAAFRPVREETWQAVAEALQKGVALSIRYRHPGEGPGDPRVIRPYAFVLAGRDWMVLAEDQREGQIKNFYLARIQSARLTGERYAIPRDFDTDAFFRNTFGLFVGKGRAFRFRVRFAPEVSGEIREMVWHPRQKIESGPHGEAILELPAESLREARRFILAYGRQATALSPPELVADLREEVAALADAYGAYSPPTRSDDSPAPRRKKRAGRTRSES